MGLGTELVGCARVFFGVFGATTFVCVLMGPKRAWRVVLKDNADIAGLALVAHALMGVAIHFL